MTELGAEQADERSLVSQSDNSSKAGDPGDPDQTPEPDTDLTDEVTD